MLPSLQTSQQFPDAFQAARCLPQKALFLSNQSFIPSLMWFAETKLVRTNCQLSCITCCTGRAVIHLHTVLRAHPPPPLPIGVLAKCSLWALSLSCVRDHHEGSVLLKFPERGGFRWCRFDLSEALLVLR